MRKEIDIYKEFRTVSTNNKHIYFRYLTFFAFFLLCLLIAGTYITLTKGLSSWGLNNTIAWAFDITNFVFWIGIAHAGTLISAILFLLRQNWRIPIHRTAEAMTLIAIIIAAFFPLIHTGRPWFAAYWMFPYPSQMGVWVNFKSPLIWDIFAISTYFFVSLLFWYLGLIPDLASTRKYFGTKLKAKLYFFLSLGWKGSDDHWKSHKLLYLILAGIVTPLVVSVHSIVSFDFAVTLLPGWHITLLPPYFVAGAIFSGCAVVIILISITRKIYSLEDIIKPIHFDNLNKIILVTCLMILYAYIIEIFSPFYSNNRYEQTLLLNRLTGDYNIFYISMIVFNIIIPQLLWFRKIRRNISSSVVISCFILVGMWMERFVLILSSLNRDFLVSRWEDYSPSYVEFMLMFGVFGIFLSLYLIFLRFFPVVSIYELKSTVEGNNHV